MTFIEGGNRTLIAISGKQLTGKDQLAEILLELLPDFLRVGLGDAIKMEFANKNNISLKEVEQNKHLYRPELIRMGNEGRMLDDGLFWVKKVLLNTGNLIIPDMRVEKEFKAFKSAGAFMLRVEADKEVRARRGKIVKEDDPTECALDNIDDWDFVVVNNSDLDNLRKQAEKICKMLPNKTLINK